MAVDLIKVNLPEQDGADPVAKTHRLLDDIVKNLTGVRLLLDDIKKPRLPIIKGQHYQLIRDYRDTVDLTLDTNRINCENFNALHVQITAPYSGRFANFLVQGADGEGGIYRTLPSPLARVGAINQNWSFDVPVSSRWATVRIQDITAVDAAQAGYTVDAWPYVADGPIKPYSRGPFDLLPTTTINANTTGTNFRALGNVGFAQFDSLVFILTITNSLSGAGAVNLRIQTAIDDTDANFDDCFSFLQATSGALLTGTYIGRITQAATGFNDRVVSSTLTANTRIDYFADRLRVRYVAASLGGSSVVARIQAYGVVNG